MSIQRKGSIFLLVLVAMTVIFILGFALIFFTSQEDYASAMSYESEISFSLAETAINECLARIEYSMNHDSNDNKLYKVLRADLGLKPNQAKEIPINEENMVALTSYSRRIAQNYYGMQCTESNSRDFNVEASLELSPMQGVNVGEKDKSVYTLHPDPAEKQGNLKIKAEVSYKGHTSKVSVKTLIRVSKTFVPPFNYFTLYVKDASVYGGSNLNGYSSHNGKRTGSLRLDNGWNFVIKNFDPIKDVNKWEQMLAIDNREACVPPGRIFLGQPLDTLANNPAGPTVIIKSSNGYKQSFLDSKIGLPSSGKNIRIAANAGENMFLAPDIVGMRLDKFEDVMEDYGMVEANADGRKLSNLFGLLNRESKKIEIDVMHLGAENSIAGLSAGDGTDIDRNLNIFDLYSGLGTYVKSYEQNKNTEINKQRSANPGAQLEEIKREVDISFPPLGACGFAPFGSAEPKNNMTITRADSTSPDFSKFSPTLVYGPARHRYFRLTRLKLKDGTKLVLPNIQANTFGDFARNVLKEQIPYVESDPQGFQKAVEKVAKHRKLVGSESYELFKYAGLKMEEYYPDGKEKWMEMWDSDDDLFPTGLKKYAIYQSFMSNEGLESMNNMLGHFIMKAKNKNEFYRRASKDKDDKNKPLWRYMADEDDPNFLENCSDGYYPFNSKIPKSLTGVVIPMREYYDGPILAAMPPDYQTYLLDFFFVPRGTEDFFRGRKTVSVGGVQYDRFVHKYISDPHTYGSDDISHTLNLNGVLLLNDSTRLDLINLRFNGNGIIYSSPMMGGGAIVISGNFLSTYTSEDPSEEELSKTIGSNMMTLVANEIIIDTSQSKTEKCIVEANLISLSLPLRIEGNKECIIKGSVVTPTINLAQDPPGTPESKKKQTFKNIVQKQINNNDGSVNHFDSTDNTIQKENVIIYNPLNSIWRTKKQYLNPRYVAKVVTGGVGKYEWKYEHQ